MGNIELEEVLLNSHNIDYVTESCHCGCMSDSVTCACKWEGRPYEYGNHLLVVLGLGHRVLDNWLINLKEVVSPIQREEYLNIFRGPKDRRRITKEERKTGVLNVR